jgi:outer membrane protein TolC
MYLSMLKKNSCLLFCLLLSGCTVYRGSFEIPSDWHTPFIAEMTPEDPTYFPWWEAFEDAILNDLIETTCDNPDVQLAMGRANALETANKVAADIARAYIEIRGLQWRLEGLEKQIHAQETSLNLNEGLATTGLMGATEQNEKVRELYQLFVQKSELQLSLDRAIFHLATLAFEPVDCLYERLSFQPLVSLPCNFPVGSPCDILQNHPGIVDARKTYFRSPSRLAFYNYQKKVLSVLEEVESALAALKREQEMTGYLKDIYDLKAENFQLTQDLNQQGLKSDAELQTAYQELLAAEDAFLQSKVKLLIEYVNLYQAQGGGFE